MLLDGCHKHHLACTQYHCSSTKDYPNLFLKTISQSRYIQVNLNDYVAYRVNARHCYIYNLTNKTEQMQGTNTSNLANFQTHFNKIPLDYYIG